MNKILILICALLLWSAKTSVWAAESVPLGDASRWKALSFRGIPANEVSFGSDGLTVSVDASASPLVHALAEPARVARVKVRARWSGELKLAPGEIQGAEGVDDFVLKLGLVESGDQTLNWFQRKFAAPWVRTLFELAPEGSGVERIHFLSTTQQADQLNRSRVHPLSDLMYETRVVALDAPGAFEMDVTLPEPVEVLALWISADGDDTGSAFTLQVQEITLAAAPAP